MNYQPASLAVDDGNQDVPYASPQLSSTDDQQLDLSRYRQVPRVDQTTGSYDLPQIRDDPRTIQTTMRDRSGQEYRCFCVPVGRPRPRFNLRQIARSILGLNIHQARRIYPNIRVVINNGQSLPVTQDYRPDRINVEVRYNVIVRVVGFY